jgi:5'-deoxynucleotidase YfbR-like HD superfamily hydrolase
MVSHDVVSEHQDRVTRMILFSQHIIHTSTEEFNFQKAVFIAQYHDVSEGISPLGDIPTNVKERLSKQSLQVLEDIELACIDILSSLNYSSFY